LALAKLVGRTILRRLCSILHAYGFRRFNKANEGNRRPSVGSIEWPTRER
jgi:hypothetical protein